MRTVLIVPDSATRKAAGIRQRSRLIWRTGHSRSHYGQGVLLYHSGEVLHGFDFRGLRDAFGARIETTDPRRVCGVLGVPKNETGIVEVKP